MLTRMAGVLSNSLRHPSLRVGLFWLAAFTITSATIGTFHGGRLSVAGGDAPAYLDGGYHLFRYGTFSEAATPLATPPAIGREPGYAVFLAMLMALDPSFGRFTPDCLASEGTCDPRTYRAIGWANLALIMANGLVMFLVGWRLRGDVRTGLIAAAYVLFNFQMNKGWASPASDRLAVLLVCVVLVTTVLAWQSRKTWPWCVAGLALAALTLVKAVFLVYCLLIAILIGCFGALAPCRWLILKNMAAAMAIYFAVIGGWSVRNWEAGGAFRLTDARGGIALSTREVFDDMSTAQYFAAFVYWTRGPGEGLARRLFPPAVIAPFDLYRPDGFYLVGQLGYGVRVTEIARRLGVDYWKATAVVDGELAQSILARPLMHIATTLPVLYRGIWIDEFIVIGLPCFCWMVVRAWRRKDRLLLLLLSIGAFNLIFYALGSLNIPRYQMTAVPAIALATSLVATSLYERRHQRPEKVRTSNGSSSEAS